MAYDLYNFPYARTYDGDLGYLIKVYNDLLEAYKNANLDYSGIQKELETVKFNLEKQIQKEEGDYTELKGKIETIEAYLGTGTGTLQETLTQIQSDITSLKTKYETVYSKLLNLETSSTQTKEEFTQRFITDETNITNLQNDTGELKSRMTSAEDSIRENSNKIKMADTEIETTNARVSSLEDTLLIGYVPLTPYLTGTRFENLNFFLYRIGITLNFHLSVDTTLTTSDIVTIEHGGINYKTGLKLGDFDPSPFIDNFPDGNFIVFGNCTISKHIDKTNPFEESTLYLNTPLLLSTQNNLGTIYAIVHPQLLDIIANTQVNVVCNGSLYMHTIE